jgi:hypothetical protein
MKLVGFVRLVTTLTAALGALSHPGLILAAEDGTDYVDMFEPLTRNAEPVGDVQVLVDAEGDKDAVDQIDRAIGVYRLPATGTLVRVERFFRVSRKGRGSAEAAPAPAPAEAANPVHNLNRSGGKLVWATAMAADHVVVQLAPGIDPDFFAAVLAPFGLIRDRKITDDIYLVKLPEFAHFAVDKVIDILRGIPSLVAVAERDYFGVGMIDDPLLNRQWHLSKIGAPGAWTFPGGTGVVAILDTGIKLDHPDLAGHIWINQAEWNASNGVPDGLDNDGNGLKDDLQGYNFVDNNGNVNDESGHGTHMAGVIGAVFNTIGVRGVCPNVRLLPLKIARQESGLPTGLYSCAVSAMDYIRKLNGVGNAGILVANHSWGGTGFSRLLFNAIHYSTMLSTAPLPLTVRATWSSGSTVLTLTGTDRDRIRPGMTVKATGSGFPADTIVLLAYDSTNPAGTTPDRLTIASPTTAAGSNVALTFAPAPVLRSYSVVNVAAAGNTRLDLDATPIFPACLPSSLVLSVGGTTNTQNEAPTSTSNFGRRAVDLFAPGEDIWSTVLTVNGSLTPGYDHLDGTSGAAAQVSAAVALARMKNGWNEPTTISAILGCVDKPAGLAPPPSGTRFWCVTNGRLNLDCVVRKVIEPTIPNE